MDKQDVFAFIQKNGVNNVKFGVTDIDGVLRGKIISIKKLFKAISEGIGFCNVIFGWDINDVCYENSLVSGWDTSYPDSFATIDLNTFRTIPWDNHKPFLADFETSKELHQVCPRALLKKTRNQAIKEGFYPKYSAEFEWFNFTKPQIHSKKRDFKTPTQYPQACLDIRF